MESVWLVRHDQVIDPIVYDCHEVCISYHKPIFKQEKYYLNFVHATSNILQNLEIYDVHWVDMEPMYRVSSPFLSRRFEIIKILTPIFWCISHTHYHGFSSTIQMQMDGMRQLDLHDSYPHCATSHPTSVLIDHMWLIHPMSFQYFQQLKKCYDQPVWNQWKYTYSVNMWTIAIKRWFELLKTSLSEDLLPGVYYRHTQGKNELIRKEKKKLKEEIKNLKRKNTN